MHPAIASPLITDPHGGASPCEPTSCFHRYPSFPHIIDLNASNLTSTLIPRLCIIIDLCACQGEDDASEHARSLAAFEEMLEFLVIRLVSKRLRTIDQLHAVRDDCEVIQIRSPTMMFSQMGQCI